MAGNKIRQVGGQKHDQVGDVLIVAAPSQWDIGAVAALPFAVIVRHVLADHPTRRDLVDRNLVRADLFGQDAQHAIHAAFPRHVGALAGEILHGALGVDGNHAPPFPGDHRRDEGLRHQDIVQHARAKLAFVIGRFLIQHRHPLVLDHRIVDNNIRRAEFILHLPPHGANRGLIGDIGLHRKGARPFRLQFGHQFHSLGRIAIIVDGDIRAAIA